MQENEKDTAATGSPEQADRKEMKKASKKKPNKEVTELKTKIEELEKQVAARDDMLLRKAAEFDNYKKRENQNKEKLTELVKASTIKELIPSLDNIERALSADDQSADYAKGITMTVKGLTDALHKLGLEEIDPENEPFDVNFHQAVMKVDDDSVGENTVVQVLQKGYRLGDTVIRHAMVKVANCD